jgi:hypothetical protein
MPTKVQIPSTPKPENTEYGLRLTQIGSNEAATFSPEGNLLLFISQII